MKWIVKRIYPDSTFSNDKTMDNIGTYLMFDNLNREIIYVSCHGDITSIPCGSAKLIEFMTCGECDGTGKVIGTYGESMVDCPRCNGSGNSNYH